MAVASSSSLELDVDTRAVSDLHSVNPKTGWCFVVDGVDEEFEQIGSSTALCTFLPSCRISGPTVVDLAALAFSKGSCVLDSYRRADSGEPLSIGERVARFRKDFGVHPTGGVLKFVPFYNPLAARYNVDNNLTPSDAGFRDPEMGLYNLVFAYQVLVEHSADRILLLDRAEFEKTKGDVSLHKNVVDLTKLYLLACPIARKQLKSLLNVGPYKRGAPKYRFEPKSRCLLSSVFIDYRKDKWAWTTYSALKAGSTMSSRAAMQTADAAYDGKTGWTLHAAHEYLEKMLLRSLDLGAAVATFSEAYGISRFRHLYVFHSRIGAWAAALAVPVLALSRERIDFGHGLVILSKDESSGSFLQLSVGDLLGREKE